MTAGSFREPGPCGVPDTANITLCLGLKIHFYVYVDAGIPQNVLNEKPAPGRTANERSLPKPVISRRASSERCCALAVRNAAHDS